MSKSTTVGRHRATPVRTSPLEAISKAVSANAGTAGRQGAAIAAATGLVLTGAIPAQAISTDSNIAAPVRVQVEAVQASAAVKLTFERAGVTSTPAPQPVIQAVSQEIAPAAGSEAGDAAGADDEGGSESEAGSSAKESAEQSQAPASGLAGAIVASAYGQIGISQDCTAMVENALRAAGIAVGDLAPAQFFAYGSQVSTPQPGDLIYYDNAGAGVPHIAVYVGNGQAVHGGWTGYSTALASAYIGSGPVFIRPAG